MKSIIYGIIIGLLVAILGLHVFFFYSLKKVVKADHDALWSDTGIVNCLKNASTCLSNPQK